MINPFYLYILGVAVYPQASGSPFLNTSFPLGMLYGYVLFLVPTSV